jgi:hypothetical protein
VSADAKATANSEAKSLQLQGNGRRGQAQAKLMAGSDDFQKLKRISGRGVLLLL